MTARTRLKRSSSFSTMANPCRFTRPIPGSQRHPPTMCRPREMKAKCCPRRRARTRSSSTVHPTSPPGSGLQKKIYVDGIAATIVAERVESHDHLPRRRAYHSDTEISRFARRASCLGRRRRRGPATVIGAAQFFYYLARLVARGVLEASADLENTPAVRLVPRSTGFELPLPVDLPERLTLDRFAFLRRTSRGATLQHSDAACGGDRSRPRRLGGRLGQSRSLRPGDRVSSWEETSIAEFGFGRGA